MIQFTTKEGIYVICKLLIIKEISKTNNSQHLVPFYVHIDLFTLFICIFCLDQIVTFFNAVFCLYKHSALINNNQYLYMMQVIVCAYEST